MYKKLLHTWFILVVVFILSIGIINFIVDPLLIYNNNNMTNKIKLNINERMQKSNLLYFKHQRDYKQLIIGTSRMTYINQNHFNKKTFNYAVSSMSSYEYKYYIDFAKKYSKIETIYIELYPIIRFDDKVLKDKVNLFDHNIYDDSFYMIKKTFSFSTFIYSLKTLFTQYKLSNPFTQFGHRYYRKDNVADCVKVQPAKVEKLVEYSLKQIKTNPILTNSYINEIQNLKDMYPNIKVIIPPFSQKYFNFIKLNHKKYYKEWLKKIIDIYGEAYLFLTADNIIMNEYKNNFKDSIHFYPFVGDMMIKQIESNFKTYDNFGIKINKNNLEKYFEDEGL